MREGVREGGKEWSVRGRRIGSGGRGEERMKMKDTTV